MVKARVIKAGHGKWNPVALNDNVVNSKEFEGLIGIEELHDYSTLKVKDEKPQDGVSKKISKKKKTKKKQSKKKVQLEDSSSCNKAQLSYEDKTKSATVKKNTYTKHEQNDETSSTVILDAPCGMEAWDGFGVPNVLLHALKDKGFVSPTEIQALTLPAAIFGRRDILGAAETGSGKTLAFGLPILHGILIHMDKDSESACMEDGTVKCKELEAQYVGRDIEESDEMVGDSESESEEDYDNSEIDFAANEVTDETEFGENRGGLGCVRVIDDIALDQFPSQTSSKTKYVPKPLFGLVLTPTRELAIQVRNHLLAAAKYTKINVSVVVGGMSSEKQERILNKAPSIIVATPGRLWELIQKGHPHLAEVEKIRFLAIDETDRMLEKGHFAELQQLLERINIDKAQKQRRQNFVFSATLTLTHEPPRYIGKKKDKGKKGKSQACEVRLTPAQKLASIMETVGLTDPKIVDVTKSTGVAHSLTEARIICSQEEKDYYLYYFLQRHPGRTIVFCNSIGCVKRLSQLFTLLQCSPWALHASMHQKQRLKNLERFTENPKGILLATDVAARGLDIPNVQHVIHYQVPRTAESYVHRSGRTARGHQEGLTVVLMEPSESRNYARLFHTLGRDPELPSFPVEDQWLPAVKERVNVARDLDKLELRARRITTEHGWLDKAVREMDLEISDDELPTSMSRDETNSVKKRAASYRKRLSILVSKPVIPKGFAGNYPKQMGKLVLPFFPGGGTSDEISEVEVQNPAQSAVDTLRRAVEDEQALKRKLNNERSKRNKKKRRKLQGNLSEEKADEVTHGNIKEVSVTENAVGGDESDEQEEEEYNSYNEANISPPKKTPPTQQRMKIKATHRKSKPRIFRKNGKK